MRPSLAATATLPRAASAVTAADFILPVSWYLTQSECLNEGVQLSAKRKRNLLTKLWYSSPTGKTKCCGGDDGSQVFERSRL